MKRTLYLVYWGNDFIAGFDGKDYEQLFNTPTRCLGDDLQYEWNKGGYDDIQIITHEKLQALRTENGFEKKTVL